MLIYIIPSNVENNMELTFQSLSQTGSTPCQGGAGVSMKDNGKPKLASGDRVELSCQGTFESFTLTKTKD